MKGLIFNELFEMVSQAFSQDMVEKIIDESNLPNEGAYTNVGTYDYHELLRILENLSKATGISLPDLEVAYGKYLFTKLIKHHPYISLNSTNMFDFLPHVDDHIHVEVLKLYPDAELPRFKCEVLSPTSLTMKYESNHPFAKLAEGLLIGCAEYFNEKVEIKCEELPQEKDYKFNFLFTISKVNK